MQRRFHPYWNLVACASLVGALLAVTGVVWAACLIERSGYVTNQGDHIEQPVPFSHEHHVRGLGIDCRYCHVTTLDSDFAGLPPTRTCMTCHSKIWTNAELLEPLRRSWETGVPIVWNRVNNLPDFCYFSHQAHVNKGIGCSTCHGRVDEMPLMLQAQPLQMRWCLECHRNPEKNLRPEDKIYDMEWEAGPNQAELGQQLAEHYQLLNHQLMQNCSLCHR